MCRDDQGATGSFQADYLNLRLLHLVSLFVRSPPSLPPLQRPRHLAILLLHPSSQEAQRLIAEPVAGISATPYQDNLRYFAVAIEGPDDSPYERGVFQLELFLPADYPMAPPKVRFLTKIYHPNVDKLGRICLDILKDKWSPALQIRTVLLSIQALLSAPNPDDPLDNNVAEVWKKDEAEAIRRAKEFTESFAMKSASASESSAAAAAAAGK